MKKLSAIALILFLLPVLALAQAPDARVEYAAVLPDNEIVIHLSVPRGQTIEEAVLTMGGASVELQAEPVALPVTRWIVLDAGENMVNFQGNVQSAMDRFGRNASEDESTGLVTFATNIEILQPTDSRSQFQASMSAYAPRANQPGCVADALNELTSQWERTPDESTRILLITAPLTRQTRCESDAFEPISAPVDIIFVGSQVEDSLAELAERSEGVLLTANLSTIEARVNEIRTFWTQPTFRLTGQVDEAPTSGRVRATLSGGGTVTARIAEFIEIEPAETEVVAEPTQNNGLATLPPRTRPSEPTQTAATDSATQEAQQSDTVEATATPLEVASSTNGEDTEGGSAAPESPSSDGFTLPPVIPGTTIPLTPTTLALGGAALAAVAVLLVSIGLGLSAGRTRANTRSRNYYRTLDTVFDRRQQSPATNATKINQPLKPLSQDDEDLLITQVIEDENFKKAMQSSQGAVVGRVRLSLIPPREFELTSAGLTVGRAKDNDIIIPGDKFISRHLLRFVVKPDGVWVERLSKANPVIISGMYMIEAPRKLRSREVIQISPTLNLVFVAREDAAPHSDFDDEVTKL